MLKQSQQRGDTLVEVLVAIAVMASITVGTLSVMNRGVAQAIDASERSSARTELNGQIELLHYIRDNYATAKSTGVGLNEYPASLWGQVKARATSATLSVPTDCSTVRADSFYLVYDPAVLRYELKDYTAGAIAAGIPLAGNGVWVEAVESGASVSTSVPFMDLYIRGCWQSVAGDNVQNMSSAVRLYD